MAARILIIEDHAENLELMTYLLTAFGYATLAADNGFTGLEAAGRERPDLIICDIQLPGIDGYEVAARLKRHDQLQAIPRVAITALAMVGDRDRVLKAGFDGYIAKPITPETFVGDVESFLRPEQRAQAGDWAAAAAAAGEETGPGLAMQALAAPRGTLLVVDNVPANLELARSIFEPFGYRVLLAGTVPAALAMAKRTRPDLVLSDVNMPEGSGLELVAQFKSDPQLKPVPVVLISATVPRDARDELLLAAGAVKFLRRPIDPALLLKEIESCLENSRRSRP
jgi:two-component system cell cycle response regulator